MLIPAGEGIWRGNRTENLITTAKNVRALPGEAPINGSDLKCRVVLVDDHPAVLRQIAELLPERFQVVATFADGSAALSAIAALQAEILVLDINLPSITGLELAGRLRTAGDPAKIVFLTAHADADYISEAFALGALGYVTKPRLVQDLIPALDHALAGKRFVCAGHELDFPN